jgi:sugar phosphate isomerase/epimerase
MLLYKGLLPPDSVLTASATGELSVQDASAAYGVARTIYIPIIKRAAADFAVSADWTPAAGDVKISKDGGAAANVTTLPTAITMGNTAIWAFALSATEMQANQVVVTVSDAATKVVEDDAFVIETYGTAQGIVDLNGIADALRKTSGLAAGILIETTAGQGSCLGATFEEIGAMLDVIDAVPGLKMRVGVCLDTCHVFAAGYPLAPAEALDDTLRRFDRHIGLARLKVIHANDSNRELGSRVDRHEGIGKGKIGREAFRLFVTHPKLAGIPLILETPKEGPDGKPSAAVDRGNLATLRRLAGP